MRALLLLAVLALPQWAAAQVTLVDTARGGSADSSGSVTTSGSDRALLCFANGDQATDINVTAFNFNTSESLTAISTATTAGTGQWTEGWQRIAPTATSASCVASGGAGEWAIHAISVSGADQTTPVPTSDVQVAESGGATSRSVTVPNVGANDLVWAVINVNGAVGTPTVDGTQRELSSSAGFSDILITKTGSGSVTIGASWVSSARASIVAGRIAAAGGGGGGSAVPVMSGPFRVPFRRSIQ